MNGKELKEKYGEEFAKIFETIEPSQFMYDDAKNEHWKSKEKLVDTFLEWETEDHHGGEGEGETYWTVYKFTDTRDQSVFYAQFNGWYASYDGATFEDWEFVEPREVIVTQFFKV